jgi:universal stress protein A
MTVVNADASRSGGLPLLMSRASDARPRKGRRRVKLGLKAILVPVDLSEWSTRATEYAADLAEQFGGELIVLHVAEPQSYRGEAAPAAGALSELPAVEREGVQRKLEHLVANLDVPARVVVRVGRPWVEICKVARDERCDLVVMCKHGTTGIMHALLGSVADKVVRHAPCAVLAVKPKGRRG